MNCGSPNTLVRRRPLLEGHGNGSDGVIKGRELVRTKEAGEGVAAREKRRQVRGRGRHRMAATSRTAQMKETVSQ